MGMHGSFEVSEMTIRKVVDLELRGLGSGAPVAQWVYEQKLWKQSAAHYEQKVGHSGRHQETSQPACLPPQCGNPHAGERRRLTSHTAIARHASIITTEIYTNVGTRRLKTVHANTHPRA